MTDRIPSETLSAAIELEGVSKLYRSYPTPRHRLLELVSIGKRRYHREVRALDDVSFALERGGRLGVVGENGSGKSTLLKLLAGVTTPTFGRVSVSGRVSALLELGAGFNPELNGRQNIAQFCLLHGMAHDETSEALPQIVQFSELGDAIDHPVKTYSSGMAVRLGFSCAVYVKPEILIVDEALSVGDAYFQNKCLQKIRSLLDGGVTFIYVTHAPDAVRALCERGLWLDHGRARLLGTAAEVGREYQRAIFSRLVRSGLRVHQAPPPAAGSSGASEATSVVDEDRRKAFAERVAPLRTGSAQAKILDISISELGDQPTDSLPFRGTYQARVLFEVFQDLEAATGLTLGVTDTMGRQLVHFNSINHGIDLSDLRSHAVYAIDFKFESTLCPGEFGLISGIGRMSPHPRNPGQKLADNIVDYCVGGARFSVRWPENGDDHDLWGVVYVAADVQLTPLS